MAHEKVDALHPATFLLLVDPNAALPSVALFICTGGASLVSGKLDCIERRSCDVCAQRAVDGRKNIFHCHKRVF